jgi:hypothetical protein
LQLVSLRFIHIAPWGAAAFEARRTPFPIPFADEPAPFGGELSQGERWENEKMRA